VEENQRAETEAIVRAHCSERCSEKFLGQKQYDKDRIRSDEEHADLKNYIGTRANAKDTKDSINVVRGIVVLILFGMLGSGWMAWDNTKDLETEIVNLRLDMRDFEVRQTEVKKQQDEGKTILHEIELLLERMK